MEDQTHCTWISLMLMTQSILYRAQNQALPREEMEGEMYIHVIHHLVTHLQTIKDLTEIPRGIDAGIVIIKLITCYLITRCLIFISFTINSTPV